MTAVQLSTKKAKSRLGYTPVARAFLLLFFTVLGLLILIPLWAILLGSFKGGSELFVNGLNLRIEPQKLNLLSWKYLFTGITREGAYIAHDYFTWFKNSVLLTVVQTTLTLFVSSFVAYGFAMYEFKGKNAIFMCVLIVLMIPLEILMLPMYVQVNAMGLYNSYAGIMLPFLASVSAIFFFRQFLAGIPHELMDAGRVDGCTEYGIYARIILPIMKPAIGSMAVLTGMGSWNSLLWPLLVISSMDKYTLPLGLNTLFTPYGNNYDLMICGSVFAVLPILLLYLLAQRYIIEGMTAGSLKG
jgi:arabinosaccharide transport system permease protein